jgi:2'-5' RNA ligase
MTKMATRKILAVAIPNMVEADQHFLQSLRRIHDPVGRQFIATHFTIYSVNDPVDSAESIMIWRDRLSTKKKIPFFLRTALAMPPLQHHKSWYAMLLPEEGFNAISKLQQCFQTAEWQNQQDQALPFIPHITVGSFNYRADCLALVNELNATALALSGIIEKITVIEIVNNAVQTLAEITLE